MPLASGNCLLKRTARSGKCAGREATEMLEAPVVHETRCCGFFGRTRAGASSLPATTPRTHSPPFDLIARRTHLAVRGALHERRDALCQNAAPRPSRDVDGVAYIMTRLEEGLSFATDERVQLLSGDQDAREPASHSRNGKRSSSSQGTSNKITSAVLRLIEQQRDGASIDQTPLKKVLNSFEYLDVYKEHFEAPFISATERCYATESAAFLASGTVSDYLWRAEACLRKEDRVERYLHATTRRELVRRTGHVLIRPHSERMWDAFQGLEPLRRMFEEHVKKAGLGAVASLVGGGGGAGELDPKAYVAALLEVHHKNAETVARSFNGEAGFAASLDKACRQFVNCNDATGSSSTKSPELIAKYADMLLRKNNKMAEEEDLERALDRVMILFKYLEDKDVFQTFYTTRLSKRLIYGVSASDESEASMITKLKEACGFEHVPIERPHQLRMSQTHDDAGDITFSIMVLSTNFWPLTPPTHDFFVPRELLGTYERFTRYYQCELRTGYLSQRYILMASAFQTAVLLQYNAVDTMGLDELVAATGIERGHLAQVVGLLVKARVLVEGEEGQYDLNPGFKSKKIRVNVNLLIKAEAKAESVDVLKTVDEDRKYVIQATIVRIMKARKTMKHQPLIQEVTAQLAPQIPDIKKGICAAGRARTACRAAGAVALRFLFRARICTRIRDSEPLRSAIRPSAAYRSRLCFASPRLFVLLWGARPRLFDIAPDVAVLPVGAEAQARFV
ncbi:Cullin family-domain-containing protein [Mycena rebaudengoi]|nr:Cullin family-domain-containing protein [Mycena rebaudengoi]